MNQDKIREVALKVAEEFGYSTNDTMRQDLLPQFLTRCLQELSKDVEPVAWFAADEGGLHLEFEPNKYHNWKPLYLHPPLTEQDKLDAARLDWLSNFDASKFILSCGKRWYWRKGYSQPHQRVETLREAIDAAMENGK